jgi:AcrR family transcriptional regulator
VVHPKKTQTGSEVPPDVRRRRAKTEAILEAATTLFSSVGYTETSLADVADKVDLTPKALYYYYRSKHDLLEAVLKRAFRQFEKSQFELVGQKWNDLPLREALLESSLDAVRGLLEHGDLLIVSFSATFHGSKLTQRLHAEYIENWAKHVEDILACQEGVEASVRREFAEHLVSSMFGTAVDAILRPRPKVARGMNPSRTYFKSIIDHYFDGISWRGQRR